ncbi:Phospho-N-acetylmuramoyl-pentapeptide-transferase [Buchnera aphidicola (Neophyllaphis podocarpi)]|uniref:phospho-N-acetylmuramoyl-pentapeptide- transferase n=1 Tax=Buchnera aphidicola TaxID=9 RepID=UPI003463C272
MIENLDCLDIKYKFVTYIIFRSICSFITSIIFSVYITKHIIKLFSNLQFNQVIRYEGPSSHYNKKNTPTMGGITIIISTIISVIIWSDLLNNYIWYILYILISYGIIGLIDDYYKITKKNSKGITAKYKYLFLSIISLIIIYFVFIDCINQKHELPIPFIKNINFKINWIYLIIMYFVIVGTSNSVNITDGLDGLAIIPVILIATIFAIISFISGNIDLSNYFNLQYICNAGELIIFCTSLIGSGIVFLWFNTYPAEIFMGDIGSLSLGGTIGIIALLLHQEILLIIIGGVLVIETISVIIQVICFKIFKIRIFNMAPIHHHYEIKGYKESKITVRLWIISLLLFLIGIISL